MQSPLAQSASEAAHLRAFALNALRAMMPVFKDHPQFCERVIQHTDALRSEPELLEALSAALKEHGISVPAAVAAATASASVNASPVTPAVAATASSVGTPVASVAAEQTAKALPATSAVPGAAPDKGPPPGLQRRRTEPTPGVAVPATAAATSSGEQVVSAPHAELFLQAKERKAAAKALWQNVCVPLVRFLYTLLYGAKFCVRSVGKQQYASLSW